MITSIIHELNQSNSSKYKLSVLEKYKNDQLLKQILELAYNKNKYTFGISKNAVIKNLCNCSYGEYTFNDALNLLYDLDKRKFVGNRALELCTTIYNSLHQDEADLFLNILGRDLRIGLNVKQINKVFKNLIPKPKYSRCDVLSNKALANIHFPAFIQLKMDGTYREFEVKNSEVHARTRSGEEYHNPVLEAELSKLPDGYYFGELTIQGDDRATGNGLINSDNPPYDDIIFTVWDILTIDEYNNLDSQEPYSVRIKRLDAINNSQFLINLGVSHIKKIENHEVDNIGHALHFVSDWMNLGLEGGVLKDFNYMFKNGTSKQQLKIKLKVDADLRIVGFTNGTIGTKREGKIGAIQYANDDGTVKGQCSGFTDKELEYFTQHKNELIGKIIAVEFNDLTKADGNDYYALSHPRFIEIRNDKSETDTLERIIELRNMARNL